MKKSVAKLYSIYQKDINSYPYYPQIYKSNKSAYLHFLEFLCSNDVDDSNFELHYIGNVILDNANNVLSVQPNFYVYKIFFTDKEIKIRLCFDKLSKLVKDNLNDFFGSLFT